ncbi:alpha/beta hydrolase domain-containing protein [Thalassotalea ponticola]|uniref:alpha/beta hydrolase domain-containing protein n=1 Tax=Thalassotalea ponticola TaxID=1523392 RepID=UPI0025B4C180|nr:alpha/beta hydrolase domain-containing protein [Thalassotalea ponticola]MDN3653789.1 alpha/beta hydrolase domain-containing protein [Thalassotalea ponticola]
MWLQKLIIGKSGLSKLILTFCCSMWLLMPHAVDAKIIGNTVDKKYEYSFKGQQYEVIAGQFELGLDPKHHANQAIVDLSLAKTNASGFVTASANYLIIQNKNPEQRKGALVEVSNRGSKASLRYFNFASSSDIPSSSMHLGDGLIQELGLSLVWVGWQGDVKASDKHIMRAQLPRVTGQTGWVRSDWTVDSAKSLLSLAHRPNVIETVYPVDFAQQQEAWLTYRVSRDGLKSIVSREDWQFSSDGKSIAGRFEPGIYELIYPAKDPLVAGIGLAIIRDTADYLKQASSPFKVDKTIAFGVSQTGRFLRQFLYQGFNETETGSKAFDGMLIHTAGAGRGSFNHRFAQPSRDGHRMSAFFYPTDIFPFTSERTRSPITNKKDGLLKQHHDPFYPNIFYTNTGYEYWGRAAALIHTKGVHDVEPLDNERIYHLASTQHYVEDQQALTPIEQSDNLFQGNPIDFRVQLRALLTHLSDWVIDSKLPPNSAYPKYADHTLTPFSHYQLPAWLGVQKPFKPHTAYALDYGKDWSKGIITNQPPMVLAEIVPSVAKVDTNGHELGGIRHPLIEAPIATFIPWSLRYGLFASEEMSDFRGATRRWPKDKIITRYQNRQAYISHINLIAQQSVKQGWLLARDLPRVQKQASWLWEWSMSQPEPIISVVKKTEPATKQP